MEVTFLASDPAMISHGPRIDQMAPRRLDVAVFAMGCFIDAEPRFGAVKGVWKTTVGFSGGKYPTPTHRDAGDHVEAVMIEYDPIMISYGQLLEFFLRRSNNVEGQPPVSQHDSRIFVKNEFERRLARAALERYTLCTDRDCQTRVSICKSFFEAEQDCQKHFLRSFSYLMEEMALLYPNEESLIHSTLATRLNGILGQRYASVFSLPEDIEFYDLSESALHLLKQTAV